MLRFDPGTLSAAEIQNLLQGGIAPRPIALVSTISKEGIPNLSPFSFYNVFGSNPPVIGFSMARRGRDGSLKDTYRNIMETGECVVQSVSHKMVEQVSLASTEYATGVDEFLKSGLTPVPSEIVKPSRVKESLFQMECKLMQMIPLGDKPGSGNLALCEVLLIHAEEHIFSDNRIEPDTIDLVARMGGDYYVRASGKSVFKVRKPIGKKGIGIDSLPEFIRHSKVFSGNDLGKLGNLESACPEEQVNAFRRNMLEFETPHSNLDVHFFRRRKDYRSLAAAILKSVDMALYKKKYLLQIASRIALRNNDVDFGMKAAYLSGMNDL